MQNKVVHAYIDSQNLYKAIDNLGWKLDFKKFRLYLKNKYGVDKAYLFIGYVPTNAGLYTHLQQAGYILVFKPTLQLQNGLVKGNVDAELVLHAMINFSDYDQAIIVSGDGDYHCLIEHLEAEGKLGKVFIPDRARYSSLLNKFGSYFVFVSDLKKSLSK